MKVAFLTAGGIAPCLSSSIVSIINQYNLTNGDYEFIGYLNGYKGLLLGESINIPKNISDRKDEIFLFGGSFLGNSRVKLLNVEDCIYNKYISNNEIPIEVAANQLIKDNVKILHTIGGDDTNTTAADLVAYLKQNNYDLTVVGFPKTIDNDIYPLSQTLGAFTAAEQTSSFFQNIVNENTTSSRQLIIHEVMGRNCGWLTAYSSYLYMNNLKDRLFFPEVNLYKKKWEVHAIYIPERKFDLLLESDRLIRIMDKYDCVNIFLSEGAGLDNIIKEMKNNNQSIPTDAFGHIRLDEINSGKWYANYFKNKLKCDKVLVQKSGYFARSSAPNTKDLHLIENHASLAVKSAVNNISGVVGIDDETNELSCIDFDRIKGGKPFNINIDWFRKLIRKIEDVNY
jgi:diphosphate-dependent phosphofructokinase